VPQNYHDIPSETRNNTLTPGGVARLTGVNLKFAPDDPEQGVFFLAEDGTRRGPRPTRGSSRAR
jgi:hypothetical protein